jgi:hypothetical protein
MPDFSLSYPIFSKLEISDSNTKTKKYLKKTANIAAQNVLIITCPITVPVAFMLTCAYIGAHIPSTLDV